MDKIKSLKIFISNIKGIISTQYLPVLCCQCRYYLINFLLYYLLNVMNNTSINVCNTVSFLAFVILPHICHVFYLLQNLYARQNWDKNLSKKNNDGDGL